MSNFATITTGSTITTELNNVPVKPGQAVVLTLFAEDGLSSIEIRVTPSGKMQIFFDDHIEVLGFDEWIPMEES